MRTTTPMRTTTRLKSTLLLVVCVLCTPLTIAQLSALLDEEFTVINLGAGLEVGRDIDGVTCHFKLDKPSRFSLDVDYVRTNFNTDDQYTYDGYVNGLSGVLTWWALNTPISPSIDFQIGLKAGGAGYGYRNYRYWEDATREHFISYDGFNVGKLGAELGLHYWFSDHLLVRPRVEAFGEWGKANLTRDSQPQSESYNGMTLKTGVALIKKVNATEAIFVEPNLLLNSYKAPAVFNVTVGYLVGF